MKSLAQRLKEKEAKEAKARLKRSDRVKSFSVKMPWCGCPSIVTEGDSLYIKKRAKRVVDLIQSRASWQFFQAMKDYIVEMEATQKKLEEEREVRWRTMPAMPSIVIGGTVGTNNDNNAPTPIIPVAPATPPTIPSQDDQSPNGSESVAITPPAQPIESPGVSVREIDNHVTAVEARESILGPVPDLPELTEEDFEESLFEVPTNINTDG
jgi:hypothetical protein